MPLSCYNLVGLDRFHSGSEPLVAFIPVVVRSAPLRHNHVVRQYNAPCQQRLAVAAKLRASGWAWVSAGGHRGHAVGPTRGGQWRCCGGRGRSTSRQQDRSKRASKAHVRTVD